MTERDYDPALNSRRCYDLALRAAREKCIRSGSILPRLGDLEEQRWRDEGPVETCSKLQAARDG